VVRRLAEGLRVHHGDKGIKEVDYWVQSLAIRKLVIISS
jgi:hypothetical protein